MAATRHRPLAAGKAAGLAPSRPPLRCQAASDHGSAKKGGSPYKRHNREDSTHLDTPLEGISSPRGVASKCVQGRSRSMKGRAAGDPGEAALTVDPGATKVTNPAKGKRVRDQKKGAHAWDHVAESIDALGVGNELLLVHSVNDDTAMRMYLPAVRDFMKFVVDNNFMIYRLDLIDDSMAKYLNHLCYIRNAHPIQGSLAVNGWVWLFPGDSRGLPNAWRSLQSWQKMHIGLEGGPTPEETLAVMRKWLRDQAQEDHGLAADMMEVAVDGYLREQDLRILRVGDVVDANGHVTLLFGRSGRGESTKTGREQGVVLDTRRACEIVRDRCRDKKPSDRVFPLRSEKYRELWKAAADHVSKGRYSIGPPHSARHTGASRDAAENRRSLDEIMKRGRWKSLASVHRYAKPHTWFAAIAAQPDDVVELGRQLMTK